MQLSVIICTHNPRPDYLRRVLDALQAQTLPREQWELLLIDNASKEPLSGLWDLSWHPHARHIREDELGLTPARLRGIKESQGELLVFVDDDNVLDADYLKQAKQVHINMPNLGVWGGQILALYEAQPSDWVKDYCHLLACRELTRDFWSNIPTENESLPCGAGLCVLRAVAIAYRERAINSPLRILLGRRGNCLNASEDTDMAFTACDMGLGMGEFCTLKLRHLIPAARLEEDYLVRIWEGMTCSSRILFAMRGAKLSKRSFLCKSYDWLKSWRLGRLKRRFYLAQKRGEDRGHHETSGLKLPGLN